MTYNFAVILCHKRDDAIPRFSQFLYEFSFSRLTESRRDDLVNSVPVLWTFISNVNHHQI